MGLPLRHPLCGEHVDTSSGGCDEVFLFQWDGVPLGQVRRVSRGPHLCWAAALGARRPSGLWARALPRHAVIPRGTINVAQWELRESHDKFLLEK